MAALTALVFAGLFRPAPASAQEPEEAEGATLEEPAMAGSPKQFRLALTGGALLWGEESSRGELHDGAIFGLDVERRVGPFVSFRIGGGYGRSTAANDTASVGLNQVVADLVGALHLGIAPLRRAGVVPFGAVGLGTVVHDPESADLVTKSQSAVAFGVGVNAELSSAFGVRAEWRRYVVDSEDLFDPADRTGEGRVADRLHAALYWNL